ncbi:MAG: M56 family metallopeptidase [Eubacterium sp.]|nr:M56 family metallopeptidase [Eubacterium sp.]
MKQSDHILYLMNLILVLLPSVSAAGSAIFILSKLLADRICRRYEVHVLYTLMRAEVLFFLAPQAMLAAGAAYGRTKPEWGVLEPKGLWTIIGHQSDSGILMIWNPRLTLVRCIVFWIWLAGFLLVFLRRFLREYLAMKKIRAASVAWEDEDIRKICGAFAQELGIRKNIKIYRCSVIASPFSAGLLRPCIFFPSGCMYCEDVRLMLKHELVHCKRKDVLYRFFMMLIRAMHWFNPVISFFERDFAHYSELACDEKVLENAGDFERYGYASLLLAALEEVQEDGTEKYVTGFTGRNEKEAERRMIHIMKGTGKITKPAAAAAAVFFAVYSPAVTYAALQGFYSVDSWIAMKAEDANSVEVEMDLNFTEYTEYQELSEEDILDFDRLRLVGKKAENIDVAISGSEDKNLLSVSLNKGDRVRISLSSENEKDSFKVGLKDENGVCQWNDSKGGLVAHTFITTKKSDYLVVVKGIKAADGKQIKILGNVYIG